MYELSSHQTALCLFERKNQATTTHFVITVFPLASWNDMKRSSKHICSLTEQITALQILFSGAGRTLEGGKTVRKPVVILFILIFNVTESSLFQFIFSSSCFP